MIWEVPELWPGKTVYVLGGGPSLKDVDLERIKGERVIATNNAYRIAPWADFLYFMDCRWWEQHKSEIRYFSGMIVTTCQRCQDIPGIKYLKRGHRKRHDERPDHLFRGNNSGVGACSLAIKLGAKKIILLGFDMKMVGGQHNWHNDHNKSTPNKIYQEQFMKMFEYLSMCAPEYGVEIVNATPGSALPFFPIVDPKEVYP